MCSEFALFVKRKTTSTLNFSYLKLGGRQVYCICNLKHYLNTLIKRRLKSSTPMFLMLSSPYMWGVTKPLLLQVLGRHTGGGVHRFLGRVDQCPDHGRKGAATAVRWGENVENGSPSYAVSANTTNRPKCLSPSLLLFTHHWQWFQINSQYWFLLVYVLFWFCCCLFVFKFLNDSFKETVRSS